MAIRFTVRGHVDDLRFRGVGIESGHDPVGKPVGVLQQVAESHVLGQSPIVKERVDVG